jgi:DNA-binding transcriptional LysR family regulator
MQTALDIPSVQAFLLISELQSFTRAAEALGTTQAAVSLKLQRLEAILGRRLIERSPRMVQLTAAGSVFRHDAQALMTAHEQALRGTHPVHPRLTLGVSDHAAGCELVPLLENLRAMSSSLTLSVTIGLSRDLLDALDGGLFDAVIVRQEGNRRGGETLANDEFGWFASPVFRWTRPDKIPLALLAAPCGIRAKAVRALDKAGIAWSEAFIGGGVSAVTAAAQAGLAVAPLAKRIAPPGLVDMRTTLGLPSIGLSKVVLYSRVSEAAKLAALRLLAATFRKTIAAG